MSNIKQIFFPITRAFDGKNGHYVYGELPFIPDSLDTMLSQELVENNLERLRKFPSARFQHKEPIGKIDFEHSVNGYRTYVDDTAFHVLIKIFDVCEKEFSMINEGSYGLSYGLMPKKTEHRRVNGKDVEVFLEGDLYEVSIVDSPALDSPLTVVRSMNKITKVTKVYDGDILYSEKTEKVDSLEPTKKLRTLRGFDLVEIEQKDGKIITNFPEKTEEPKPNISDPTLQEVERLMKKQERGMANLNLEQQHRKQNFPEICSAECDHRTCPYYKTENFGKPCLSRFDEPDERVKL